MQRILIVILLIINNCLFGQGNLPRAREAVLLESSSPSEVMVRATGFGIDRKHRKPKAKTLDKSANNDAKKTAVWFVLFGGSDPLLQTDGEKQKFEKIQEDFFKTDNIHKYISWEADYYGKRLKIDNGKMLKVEKTFKINKSLLEAELVKRSIIIKPASISKLVGMPTIMVIPETTGDITPLELLKIDPDIKKGAEVIESYLTAKKYTVIVPEQQQVLQELTATQYALGGAEEDYSYLLALSIGSDVYISYNVSVASRKIGSSRVKKAVVGCRAYETTTGRLLGTETGYSRERLAPNPALIEEAMNDAIDKVLSRISNYWKSDIKNGVQYKMIISVCNSYDSDEAEDIIFKISDLLKEIASSLKENSVADYTYDVLIWVQPDQYPSATDIYRTLKSRYNGAGSVKKISISRKLILLSVSDE
jgi:predicted AlkP superfamily pyrophosphatase or phosphodiesterase